MQARRLYYILEISSNMQTDQVIVSGESYWTCKKRERNVVLYSKTSNGKNTSTAALDTGLLCGRVVGPNYMNSEREKTANCNKKAKQLFFKMRRNRRFYK